VFGGIWAAAAIDLISIGTEAGGLGQCRLESDDWSRRRDTGKTQRFGHEFKQGGAADQLIGRQADFDLMTEQAEQDAYPVMASGRLPHPALSAAKAPPGHPDPVALLKHRGDRGADGGNGVLPEMGDSTVIQPGRRSAEFDQAQNPGRADDMANLLGIVESRKKVPGKKRLRHRPDTAHAGFAPDADTRRKCLNAIAMRQIECGHMLPAAFAPETEPAQPAGVQQRTENVSRDPPIWGTFQREKGAGLGGNHDGYDAPPRLCDSKR